MPFSSWLSLANEAFLYAQNAANTVVVCESASERDEIAKHVLGRLRVEGWLGWEIDLNEVTAEGDIARLILAQMPEMAPMQDRDNENLSYALHCIDGMAERHPGGVFIVWRDFHFIDRRELRQAEALLREHIQCQKSTAHLFLGDQRIIPIFADYKRPFYKSTMNLFRENSK